MKRVWLLLLSVVLLTGCGGNRELNRAMELRSDLLKAKGCSFETQVTADYGDKVHIFTMACTVDDKGELTFAVKKPDTLAGITGNVSDTGGKLTFDGTALAFPLLAEDRLAPVSAPWLLLKTLRSGYLSSAGMDGDHLRITIDDRYEEDALTLDVWVNRENRPLRAEICWAGQKILTMDVENFRME